MDIAQIVTFWDSFGWVGKTLAILLILHPVASVIVAATPTPKDDKWPGLIYKKVIMPLALNVGKAFDKGPKQ